MSSSASSSASPSSPSLDRPTLSNSVFFLCDIQETFRGKIVNFDALIAASVFLTRVAQATGIPVLTTEQKPFKPTVAEIQPFIQPEANPACKVFGKSLFSMLVPELRSELATMPARRHVVLFGIESHVCVLQTALDLLRDGYQVHVVVDAVSSQTTIDREIAFERLKAEGMRAAAPGSLVLTSAESIIYEIIGDAQHPLFKSIVPAIKDYAAAKKAQAATQAKL